MNPINRQNPLTLIDEFIQSLDELAGNENNRDLNCAIDSWCRELSINQHFPQASTEIIKNKNQWIQDNRIYREFLPLYQNLLVTTDKKIMGGIGNSFNRLKNISNKDFYHNVQETKEEMNVKSIVLIAFVLTGIGLLLYLFNKKEDSNKSQYNNQLNNDLAYQPSVEEKQVLALLIKSDRYQELIHSLNKNNEKFWQTEDASKLYGATQGLWIGAKSKFDQSRIKQKLNNCNPVTSTSEYDVHFVKIELDKNDSRFHSDVNPMDRRDAFMELGNKSLQITVSPRLSCKAYENTEFYSR